MPSDGTIGGLVGKLDLLRAEMADVVADGLRPVRRLNARRSPAPLERRIVVARRPGQNV